MTGRRLAFVLLASSSVLAGCTSSVRTTASAPAATTATAPSATATASRQSSPSAGSITAEPTYSPFTVGTGPPSGVAAVITAQTAVFKTDSVIYPLTLAWAKTGNTLFITTYGSGSCPSVVEAQVRMVSTGPQRITLRASNPENPAGGLQTCTADLAPTTSTVTVPPDIDPAKPVVVTLNGRTYTLPGR